MVKLISEGGGTLSLEFLGGVVVGMLLAMLPMTPVVYIGLSILLAAIGAHIGWRIFGMVTQSHAWRTVWVLTFVATLLAFLVWGFSVRFAHAANAPATAPMSATAPRAVEIGTASGQGSAGIVNGNQYNYFNAVPRSAPKKKRPLQRRAQIDLASPPPCLPGSVLCQSGNIGTPQASPPMVGTINGGNNIIAPNANAPITQNNYGPPRDPNGLYQGDTQVGRVQQPSIRSDGTVLFRVAAFSAYPDPSQPLEYQDMKLHCNGIPIQDPNTFVGQLSAVSVGMSCTVVPGR